MLKCYFDVVLAESDPLHSDLQGCDLGSGPSQASLCGGLMTLVAFHRLLSHFNPGQPNGYLNRPGFSSCILTPSCEMMSNSSDDICVSVTGLTSEQPLLYRVLNELSDYELMNKSRTLGTAICIVFKCNGTFQSFV